MTVLLLLSHSSAAAVRQEAEERGKREREIGQNTETMGCLPSVFACVFTVQWRGDLDYFMELEICVSRYNHSAVFSSSFPCDRGNSRSRSFHIVIIMIQNLLN